MLILGLSATIWKLEKESTVQEHETTTQSVQDISDVQYLLEQHVSSKALAHQIAFYIIAYAEKNKLSHILVTAIVLEESRGTPRARGKVGEIGLMQIHPRFWRGVFPDCGKDLWNIKTNICYGTNILRMAMSKSGTSKKAIAWYNGNEKSIVYVDKVHKRIGILYLSLAERNSCLCLRDQYETE
jgi:hypothetical protein